MMTPILMLKNKTSLTLKLLAADFSTDARRWMTAGTCVYPCALLRGMLSGHQNGHRAFGTGKKVSTSSNMQTKCTDDNTAGRICGSCPTKLYNHSCIPYHREGWVRRTELRCCLVRTQMRGMALQPK